MYVSALVMIKEKVIKSIPTEITTWFANWNDDRKFHPLAGILLLLAGNSGHLQQAHAYLLVTLAPHSTCCMLSLLMQASSSKQSSVPASKQLSCCLVVSVDHACLMC